MGPVCNWQNWQFCPVGRARLSTVFVDEFVVSLATADFGDSDGILNNTAPVNPTDGTPLLRRSLFNDGKEEITLFVMGAVRKSAAPGEQISGAGDQYCKFSCRRQCVVHIIVKIIVISFFCLVLTT
jgi:hypothetical protein